MFSPFYFDVVAVFIWFEDDVLFGAHPAFVDVDEFFFCEVSYGFVSAELLCFPWSDFLSGVLYQPVYDVSDFFRWSVYPHVVTSSF